MISPELKHLLEKQNYAFIGNHSAIKICSWTKHSLLDEGTCYKEKFYGIKAHRCCQLSTTIGFCQNRCLFCWRPIEYTEANKMPEKGLDKPKELIKNAVKAQQKQLMGFKGNKKVNMKKYNEAQEPTQFAISLSGEPTLYPLLNEFIQELHKLKKTTFVVSNGLNPEIIKQINPTQLYISVSAPNKKLFEKITQSQLKNAWQRFNQSLELLKNHPRATLRITLIKEWNMIEPENYAKIIQKANPKFVEVKAYMCVGYSKQRLEYKNMPLHSEVKEFAKKIAQKANLKIIDEQERSRVVLLMTKDDKSRFISI